jgi:adenylylsulfate kinase
MPPKDLHKRSIVKAVTFRVLVIMADALVIFFITRRYDLTLGFIVLSNITSTLLYYFHERLWDKVHWGRA